MLHTDQNDPRHPGKEKHSAFWRAFVVIVLGLWAGCFALDVNRGYYLLCVVAALLMALKYGWVFSRDPTVSQPPRQRWDTLREQLRPRVRQSAALSIFMALAMLVAACIAFLTGFTASYGKTVHLEGRIAVLFGFVCLLLAARAAFAAYVSLLLVRTLNFAEAEAIAARYLYMTYAVLVVAGTVAFIWIS